MDTEWLILADHAEIVNGKLYLMGGGWESLTLNSPDLVHQFGLAVAFSVPWNETNQPQAIEIEIVDDDAIDTLAKVEGAVEVGRPPGIPLGRSQRTQLAMNLGVQFSRFGGHVVIVRIEGQVSRRFPFRVERGHAIPAGLPE